MDCTEIKNTAKTTVCNDQFLRDLIKIQEGCHEKSNARIEKEA